MPLITYDDKVTAQVSPLPAEEKWVSADANEVKEVVNAIIEPVGLLKSDGTDVTAAVSGTDYLAPDAALVDTQVLVANASGQASGSDGLKYDEATKTLTIGEATAATTINIEGNAQASVFSNNPTGLFIRATAGFAQLSSAATTAVEGDVGVVIGTNNLSRLEIDEDGAWRVSNNTQGTAGQVITSQGAGVPPEWQDIPAPVAAGPDTSVQFNDGGAIAGDAGLTYNVVAGRLNVNGNGSDAVLQVGEAAATAGEIVGDALIGLSIYTTTGQLSVASADQLSLQSAQDIALQTGVTERLRILADGTWEVEGSAGTAGQVLTSAGAGAAPAWADASPGVYEAALTQKGTGDPTVVVFTNNTGRTVTWTRDSAGIYLGTFSSNCVIANSGVMIGAGTSADPIISPVIMDQFLFVNRVQITTLTLAADGATEVTVTPTDELLASTLIRLILG